MVLEAAIGLIFVYLLFSLICSALSEIVSWFLNLRARTLRDGIETLLRDDACTELVKQNPRLKSMFDKGIALGKQTQNVTGTLYAHPLIQGMTHGNRYPSYIPKHIFAAAFMDVLRSVAKKEEAGPEGASQQDAMQKLRGAIASLPEDSAIRQQLEAALDDTVTSVQDARARVEQWFDDSMERVSGWYKRRAQAIVLVVAAVVVGVSNADSVMIVRSLAHDSALRAGLVAAAEQYVKAGPPVPQGTGDVTEAVEQLREIQNQLSNLRLPMGWVAASQTKPGEMPDPRRIPQGWDWMGKLVGLLFTLLAVSMGAPFWFDTLNRVVNARLTGAQPPETQAKKDKKKEKDPEPQD